LTEARARFDQRFAELRNKARAYFADYKAEAKDEAIANSLFLTWHHFVSLVKRGKANDALLTSTFYYSCRQTRSGRMMKAVKASKFRDLWEHERKNGHAILRGLNLDAFVSLRSAIPDTVAFKIDTPAWLESLPALHRQRAKDLSEGYSTQECAKRWGVTGPAVSLFRKVLLKSYLNFIKD
jgi:hypothetical protein